MSKYRWKFLELHGKTIRSANGDMSWKIGEWNEVDKDTIQLCHNGLHCSKTIYDAFSYVQGNILAKVEVAGSSEISDDKEAYQKMRIVKAYKWTKKDSVALAIFSAELCLDRFEKLYPDDKRPRQAIEAAKAVLLHDTAKNRSALFIAESAAWSASVSVAEPAARSAARSAVFAVSTLFAVFAAESANESAARSAASDLYAARSNIRNQTIKKIEKWLVNHVQEMEEL